jgi:hypothetical protein
MSSSNGKPGEYAWEKELAPKISRGRLGAAVAVYVVWLGFLAFLSAERWFGSLQ